MAVGDVNASRTSSRRVEANGRRGTGRRVATLVAAFALGAVCTPVVARAADGDPLLMGAASNLATHTTFLRLGGGGSGAAALRVQADGANTALIAESAAGSGVQGAAVAPGESGVRGTSLGAGIGVRGTADAAGGTGVLASSALGTALRVEGTVSMSRSGRAVVPAHRAVVTVAGVGLTEQSLVLATLQRGRHGVWIRAANPDPVTGSFTIVLNKAPGKRLPVAWFVLG